MALLLRNFYRKMLRQRSSLAPKSTTRYFRNASKDNKLKFLVSAEQETIEISGVFDQITAKIQNVKIPMIWMRDHCQCSKCYNHDTFQRNEGISNLFDEEGNFAYSVTDVIGTNDEVTVTWSDGHVTKYSIEKLCAAHISDFAHSTEQKHKKKLWNKEIMTKVYESGKLNTQYDELMGRDNKQALAHVYRNLLEYGVAFVKGAPSNDRGQATFDLCGRVTMKQNTIYGPDWVFEHEEKPKYADTAYSNIKIGAHNDNTYYGRAPAIQVFHCLHRAAKGGKTLVVDGFKAAEQLKNTDPDSYHLLTRLNIPHHYKSKDEHLLCEHLPILRTNNSNEIVQIRYNPYDRATMILSKNENKSSCSAQDVYRFYRAYHGLGRRLNDPSNEYWVQLQPGTVIFVDNWRVLHGRSQFSGKRVMCGAYLARDEFISQARMMKLY